MYIVVIENIRGYAGQTFRSCKEYNDEAHFNEVYYEHGMQTEYRVVAKGVSQEEANRLCSTPLDNIKVLTGQLQMLGNQFRQRRDGEE